MRQIMATALMLTSLFGLTACEDTFDRVSEVKTVRVLGVRKTPAYPAPGEAVKHTMLWHDGRPDKTTPVQISWLAGCHNPPADRFFGCFEQLGETIASLDAPSDPRVGSGDTFSLTLPGDIIKSRSTSPDPGQPAFGTSFVFFAACAGQLGVDRSAEPDAIPIGCFDKAGKRVGAEGFVLGYTVNFAYDNLDNAPPVVEGFRVDGRDVSVDCLDDACLDPVAESAIDCSGGDPRCIARCEADGDEDDCPEIRIEPRIAASSAEQEPIASQAKDKPTYEQIWIDYFADRGRVGAQLRLYSGADTGPRDDFASRFYAPSKPGPLLMWAVVKDARGGVSWVRLRLQVR